jgi:hypothetical protein
MLDVWDHMSRFHEEDRFHEYHNEHEHRIGVWSCLMLTFLSLSLVDVYHAWLSLANANKTWRIASYGFMYSCFISDPRQGPQRGTWSI